MAKKQSQHNQPHWLHDWLPDLSLVHHGAMQIRQVNISRYRGIKSLSFDPGSRCVILGPQNAGKSTVLEALDLLLHQGLGRPRQPPTEVDYFDRKPEVGFEIEAVVGKLSDMLLAEVREHLEGWKTEQGQVVPEPDGEGIEPIIRVRVRGTPDLGYRHEFSKPEAEGAYFGPKVRTLLGWVFDGRTRDPQYQLSFYQGGLLDKLFINADLNIATETLRGALSEGANRINADSAVEEVLNDLSEDLLSLGLLKVEQRPAFEAGDVSQRQLLQTLRLAMPSGSDFIPLFRQGRGAQRLVLISVLLRLAALAKSNEQIIGGFEEPEEALEPLRQAQLAGMLIKIADKGGQVFVVTHSPEIARRFEIDDFFLMAERSTGAGDVLLRNVLTPPVRQTYERRLDGAVVRGLFARIPVLVEGPGDRAVFEVFWRSLAESGLVRPAEELGVDAINCEGSSAIPMHVAVLAQAGKKVVAWVELDTQEVCQTLARLRNEQLYAALVLYDESPGMRNLEEALAHSCSIEALVRGMKAIAEDRGYSWDVQKQYLVSICKDESSRERIKCSTTLVEALGSLESSAAREIVTSGLSSAKTAPFDLKGGRQARIFATTVVDVQGVPESFAVAFTRMNKWIQEGCTSVAEFPMWSGNEIQG